MHICIYHFTTNWLEENLIWKNWIYLRGRIAIQGRIFQLLCVPNSTANKNEAINNNQNLWIFSKKKIENQKRKKNELKVIYYIKKFAIIILQKIYKSTLKIMNWNEWQIKKKIVRKIADLNYHCSFMLEWNCDNGWIDGWWWHDLCGHIVSTMSSTPNLPFPIIDIVKVLQENRCDEQTYMSVEEDEKNSN